MRTYITRFENGEDIKLSLLKCVETYQIKAGIILTCVGSLETIAIRLANASKTINRQGSFEIVSLVGTLSQDGLHLHICVSDENGKTIGGHLLNGSIVFTTAEIILGDLDDVVFRRVLDQNTHFKELVILDL